MPWMVTLEDEYRKNAELKAEDIIDIQSWMREQPHLPCISGLDIVMFLQACGWNISESKKTIEYYYTCRTSLTDFFSARDPFSSEIQDISKVIHVTILPQSDQYGNRILWGSLVDPDANKYSFASAVKYFTMTSEVFQLENGTVPGFIVVYDVKNLSFKHLYKTSLSHVSKYCHYAQEAATFPVKGIHYLNTNSVLNKLISFSKPFLGSNILNLLQLHSDLQTFFKSIPQRIVPKDYGGDEPTLEELNELNLKKVEKYKQYFIDEQMVRVDESKRITHKQAKSSAHTQKPLDNVSESFRDLSVD